MRRSWPPAWPPAGADRWPSFRFPTCRRSTRWRSTAAAVVFAGSGRGRFAALFPGFRSGLSLFAGGGFRKAGIQIFRGFFCGVEHLVALQGERLGPPGLECHAVDKVRDFPEASDRLIRCLFKIRHAAGPVSNRRKDEKRGDESGENQAGPESAERTAAPVEELLK